jgi:hypothetical protein
MYLPLRAISVFHAAARAGSLTKAAAELNVTPSAVSPLPILLIQKSRRINVTWR